MSLVWWHTPAIPGLGRLRQDNDECETSLGFLVRPCQKKERKGRKGREGRKEGWIMEGRKGERKEIFTFMIKCFFNKDGKTIQ
jgi:hypothetical protein